LSATATSTASITKSVGKRLTATVTSTASLVAQKIAAAKTACVEMSIRLLSMTLVIPRYLVGTSTSSREATQATADERVIAEISLGVRAAAEVDLDTIECD
jgi:hypothetical protein